MASCAQNVHRLVRSQAWRGGPSSSAAGAWAFRVDAGFHPETGRRRQVLRQGFATKKQAEAALTDVLQAATRNSVVAKSSTRLGDFLDDWLAGQKTRLRETTWHSYRARHQARSSSARPGPAAVADDVAAREVLHGPGRVGRQAPGGAGSKERAEHPRGAAQGACRRGASGPRRSQRGVERSGANGAPVQSSPRGRRTTSESSSPPYATIGCTRRSSCWRRPGCVEVRCSVCAGATSTSTVPSWPSCRRSRPWAGQMIVAPPKTQRSRRTIYLDSQTVAVLKEHRRRQREEQLAAGPVWDSSNDLVFRDELGGPLHPDWFSQRVQPARTPRRRLREFDCTTCATRTRRWH